MHEFRWVQEFLVDLTHKIARHPLVMGLVLLIVEHEIGKGLHSRIHFGTPVVCPYRKFHSAVFNPM
jgi:hypothetical protein